MTVTKIYFDMDGVLADFNRGVKELCNIEPVDQETATSAEKSVLWKAVRQIDHFYGRLELIPGAEEMFRRVYAVYGDRCEILSGIPRPFKGVMDAGEDKIAWIGRIFGPEVKVNIVYKEEKKNYCNGPGDVLIDDYLTTIREWRRLGGTGILHRNAADTLEELRKMGIL